MNIPDDQTNRRILVIDNNRALHNCFRAILRGADSGKNALDEGKAGLFGEAPIAHRFRGASLSCGSNSIVRKRNARPGVLKRDPVTPSDPAGKMRKSLVT